MPTFPASHYRGDYRKQRLSLIERIKKHGFKARIF